MVEKLDHFYQSLYTELVSKLGEYSYKGIDVAPLKAKFYLNNIINSTKLIHEIEKLSSEAEIERLVENYFENFFVPINSFQKVKLVSKDIFRYLYHQLFHKSKKTEADFFVFITNKKFFSFIHPVKEALEQSGKKVAFLLWDFKDLDKSSHKKIHLPIADFPFFWKKGYFQYHKFVTLIDRANGFLPLLENKKVILIEGDLESQHIIGMLGKKNQFETYCLQWGFFGKTAIKSGWREMPFDKFLVWGNFFADCFKIYNPKLSIVSCGHPTLKENDSTRKGKAILFAVQKRFGEHITTNDVLHFIHFAAEIATKMPEFKVIIRSHPDFEIPENIKAEYKSNENIIWHDYKNFSLNHSFDEAKYCVSISSTVSLESIAYGCYPIYLKINDLPLQIHKLLAENSEHKHVFDFENFVEGIHQLEKDNLENYVSDFKKKLYKNLGTAAVNAIVSEMNN